MQTKRKPRPRAKAINRIVRAKPVRLSKAHQLLVDHIERHAREIAARLLRVEEIAGETRDHQDRIARHCAEIIELERGALKLRRRG